MEGALQNCTQHVPLRILWQHCWVSESLTLLFAVSPIQTVTVCFAALFSLSALQWGAMAPQAQLLKRGKEKPLKFLSSFILVTFIKFSLTSSDQMCSPAFLQVSLWWEARVRQWAACAWKKRGKVLYKGGRGGKKGFDKSPRNKNKI